MKFQEAYEWMKKGMHVTPTKATHIVYALKDGVVKHKKHDDKIGEWRMPDSYIASFMDAEWKLVPGQTFSLVDAAKMLEENPYLVFVKEENTNLSLRIKTSRWGDTFIVVSDGDEPIPGYAERISIIRSRWILQGEEA